MSLWVPNAPCFWISVLEGRHKICPYRIRPNESDILVPPITLNSYTIEVDFFVGSWYIKLF